MIAATELRIGNLILFDNEVDTIISLGITMADGRNHSRWYYERLTPIPLTPAILEDAGLIKKRTNDTVVAYTLELPNNVGHIDFDFYRTVRQFEIFMTDNYDYGSGNLDITQTHYYLHQIQNLHYALTGEELILKSK